MSNTNEEFLGSIMKAIACTPNRNFNNESYTRGVIEPTSKIRQLMQEPSDKCLTDNQMKEVLSMLATIFETKMVDMKEREERINDILKLNNLENTFSSRSLLVKESV